MFNLKCSICQERYNISTKLPRLLICNHSFCSECIKNLKKHENNFLICPKDEITTKFKNSGVEEFPLNFDILEKLRKKNSEKKNKKERCKEHGKKLELICLSDNQQICVDCVLFGIHKNCDYDKKENYLEFVKNKVKYLEKIFLDISENNQFLGFNKMEEQKELFSKKIETVFINIEDFFISKKKEILNHLANIFDDLELAHSEIYKKKKKIENQKDKWIFNFNQLKKEINLENPSFSMLIKKLKPNSEFENSFKVIDENKKELKKLEYLFLNKKINNFELIFNFADLKKNFKDNLKIKENKENKENIDINVLQKKIFDEEKEKFLNLKSLSDLSDDEKKSESSFILENNENDIFINNNFVKSKNSRRNSFLKKSQKKIKNINFDLDKELTTFLGKNKSMVNLQIQKKDFLKYNKSFLIKNNNNDSSNNTNNSYFSEENDNQESLQIPQYLKKKRLTIGNRNLSSIFSYKKKNFNEKGLSLKNNNKSNHNFYKKSKGNSNLNLNSFKTPEINHEKKYRTFYKKSKNTTKKNLSKKKIMNFKNLGINDHTLEKIIQKVNLNDYIKILDLSNNQISIFGFEKILENFCHHKNLEQIILSNNFLDNSVLQKINNKAKKLFKLKSFVLKKNKLIQNRAQLIRNINILNNKGFDIQI